MDKIIDLLDPDLIVPAVTVLGVFVLFVLILKSLSSKPVEHEPKPVETDNVTGAGSQFVEEDGAVVRRSLRVKSKHSAEAPNGTAGTPLKTADSVVQDTPRTRRTAAKAKTPVTTTTTPYSTRLRKTTPTATPEVAASQSQAKSAKTVEVDEDDRAGVTSPARRSTRPPRV